MVAIEISLLFKYRWILPGCSEAPVNHFLPKQLKFSQTFLKNGRRQHSGQRHHRLVFIAGTYLPYNEKSVLRELRKPRQHHKLQPRPSLGDPQWVDGSSSFPAFQPRQNLYQLSLFQVNQLKSPGAAERLLFLLHCRRRLLSREAAVCSFIWEGNHLRTGQGWQNSALNQELMALAAKPPSDHALQCTSSLHRQETFPKPWTTHAEFPFTAGTARSVCGELLLLDNAQIFPTSSARWDTAARLSS